jgi:hypothetical protein
MKFSKYLTGSFNLLNIFLLVTAGAFFFFFIYPLLNALPSVSIPAPKGISPGTFTSSADEKAKPDISDFAVIGGQNLFHPERVIPPEKPVKKDALIIPKPELVLNGTMIAGGLKIAFVQDKKAAPSISGRGARQIALREGDAVSGYTLRKITEKSIVLANGEDQMILDLDELKERKIETTVTGKAPGAVQAIQPAQRLLKTPPSPAMPPAAPRPVLPPFQPPPGIQPETSPGMPPVPPATAVPMQSSHLIKRP